MQLSPASYASREPVQLSSPSSGNSITRLSPPTSYPAIAASNVPRVLQLPAARPTPDDLLSATRVALTELRAAITKPRPRPHRATHYGGGAGAWAS